MVCTFETLFFYFGALSACVLAVVYAYFKMSFTYWKKRNVPCVTPIFPFENFADFLFFRKSIGHVHEDIYKKLEGENMEEFMRSQNPYSYFVIKILLKMFS